MRTLFPSSLGMNLGISGVCVRLSHIDGFFSTSNHESQAILAADAATWYGTACGSKRVDRVEITLSLPRPVPYRAVQLPLGQTLREWSADAGYG